MLYMLYVLKRAKRANFSTIGIFVNLLMLQRYSHECDSSQSNGHDKIAARLYCTIPTNLARGLVYNS